MTDAPAWGTQLMSSLQSYHWSDLPLCRLSRPKNLLPAHVKREARVQCSSIFQQSFCLPHCGIAWLGEWRLQCPSRLRRTPPMHADRAEPAV